MRKIIFNGDTIAEIRKFIEDGNSLDEACNRFTLKADTLRRVLRENNIFSTKSKLTTYIQIDKKVEENVCNIYSNTKTPLHLICKEFKLDYHELQYILNRNYSEDHQNRRKSELYRLSKQADKNPMSGKFDNKHHGYKGLVDDGNGYLMILKPSWYTGRKGSDHVFYHSVVICENLGLTEVPRGFVVHHIDGNPHNNEINNLSLMTVSGHGRLHAIQNKMCKVQRLSDNGVGGDLETLDND